MGKVVNRSRLTVREQLSQIALLWTFLWYVSFMDSDWCKCWKPLLLKLKLLGVTWMIAKMCELCLNVNMYVSFGKDNIGNRMVSHSCTGDRLSLMSWFCHYLFNSTISLYVDLSLFSTIYLQFDLMYCLNVLLVISCVVMTWYCFE
jgi:hypothetical protein